MQRVVNESDSESVSESIGTLSDVESHYSDIYFEQADIQQVLVRETNVDVFPLARLNIINEDFSMGDDSSIESQQPSNEWNEDITAHQTDASLAETFGMTYHDLFDPSIEHEIVEMSITLMRPPKRANSI